jgi:hypothetical protein
MIRIGTESACTAQLVSTSQTKFWRRSRREKLLEIGIVRIQVKELRDLGLTVQPRPDPHVKGHVVVPEFNARDFVADKSRFTPSMLALATLASDDSNIVIWPAELR